jgi:uncharacterized membrane protein
MSGGWGLSWIRLRQVKFRRRVSWRKVADFLTILLCLNFLIQFLAMGWGIYYNNGYSGYDLGKNNQSIWLLSRLETPFNTIRGMNAFGDHMHVVFLFLAPIYWFIPDPGVLLFLNVFLRAGGVYGIYWYARGRLGAFWGLFFAFILSINPSYNNAALDHFYPEALAGPLLIVAFILLEAKRYWIFSLLSLVVLTLKEDAPTIVFMLGGYHMLRGALDSLSVSWPDQGGSDFGGWFNVKKAVAWVKVDYTRLKAQSIRVIPLMIFSIVYFIFCLEVMGHYSGGERGFSDGNYFGDLSERKYDPDFYIERLSSNQSLDYLDSIFGPFAYLAAFMPHISLIAAPSLFFNVFTPWPYARDVSFHYQVYITPFFMLASIHFFMALKQLLPRIGLREFTPKIVMLAVAVVLLNASIAYNDSLSRLPLRDYDTNVAHHLNWYETNAERMIVERAYSMIPPYANVSADPFLVTRISSRKHIYQFPNPWIRDYYGQGHDVRMPDPETIEYILVKYRTVNSRQKMLVENLVETGEYTTIYSEGDNIMLLKRS